MNHKHSSLMLLIVHKCYSKTCTEKESGQEEQIDVYILYIHKDLVV